MKTITEKDLLETLEKLNNLECENLIKMHMCECCPCYQTGSCPCSDEPWTLKEDYEIV